MLKLKAIVLFLGIVLWSAPVLAQEVNVCSFDLKLMTYFVRGDLKLNDIIDLQRRISAKETHPHGRHALYDPKTRKLIHSDYLYQVHEF